jgi:hypothetical protein
MKFVYTYVEFDFSMEDEEDYELSVETVAKAYNDLMGEVFEIENDIYLDDHGVFDTEAIINLISDVTGWLVSDSRWKIIEL